MISCGRVHLSHTHTPTRIGRQTGRQSAVTLRQEAWCCCCDRLVSAFTLHYHSAEWTSSYSQHSSAALCLSSPLWFLSHIPADSHTGLLFPSSDWFSATRLQGKFTFPLPGSLGWAGGWDGSAFSSRRGNRGHRFRYIFEPLDVGKCHFDATVSAD